jgi:hypothetical protein
LQPTGRVLVGGVGEKKKGKGKGKRKKSHMLNGGSGPQNLILVLQLESLLYGCEEIKKGGKEIH